MLKRILATRADQSVILIRLLVGLVVFFPEGLQKLLFPDVLGAGRFARIGIPWPEITGPWSGSSRRSAARWSLDGRLQRWARTATR